MPSMCAYVLASSLLAAAPAHAAHNNTANAGVSHVKAAPLFPVPASARVHGQTGTSTTSTTPAPTTTAPATASGAGGTSSGGTSSASGTTSGAATGMPSAGGTAGQAGIPTPGTGSATRLGGVRKHGRSAGKLSTGALVAAVLAGLLVLLCAIWAIVRWLAVEPRWTRTLAYSLEEASFRTSATWAELLDWARLGR